MYRISALVVKFNGLVRCVRPSRVRMNGEDGALHAPLHVARNVRFSVCCVGRTVGRPLSCQNWHLLNPTDVRTPIPSTLVGTVLSEVGGGPPTLHPALVEGLLRLEPPLQKTPPPAPGGM